MDSIELKQFNKACEDFLLGKYILANIKIKALLDTIGNNNRLTEIAEKALSELDFTSAFNASITDSGLMLPTEDNQIIAYCYHVLYNIDMGTVSFLDFLNNYFSHDNNTGTDQFKLFADTIIKPFNKAINNIFESTYSKTVTEDEQVNVYHKLKGVAQVNLDNIELVKLKGVEKEELSLLLKAIVIQSERCDKKQVYALMVGLEYFAKFNKKARNIYLQLKDCFEQN